MSVKKWIGVGVGVAIVAAMGLEFWTFSEMIWRGFYGSDSTEHSRTLSEEEHPRKFQYGLIEGTFKILYLRATRPDWSFHGVVNVTNQSDRKIHLTISGVRLQSGKVLSITEPVVLEPGTEQTIQFQVTVPPAQSPIELKIDQPDYTENQTRWIILPKVPVRRD